MPPQSRVARCYGINMRVIEQSRAQGVARQSGNQIRLGRIVCQNIELNSVFGQLVGNNGNRILAVSRWEVAPLPDERLQQANNFGFLDRSQNLILLRRLANQHHKHLF